MFSCGASTSSEGDLASVPEILISSQPPEDVSSHSSLLSGRPSLCPQREKCKSSMALGALLGRWSRSRSDVAVGSSPIRKCNTVVSLNPDRPLPIHPYNRLRPRNSANHLCSRCSSLLSMASSSKYSVNEGNYVTVGQSPQPAPTFVCKLCICQLPVSSAFTLHCSCAFCLECTKTYIEFEINQGAYDISCPDAMCKSQGIISLEEIESLVSPEFWEKYNRFRQLQEVDRNVGLAWCPTAGCETVCSVGAGPSATCPTCATSFCPTCLMAPHPSTPCRPLQPPPDLPFGSGLIKCCPVCYVPIEKDEGCAQMMCKRCKHIFCWYCLTSLDDDIFLRHFDKGPCKNKLGHSRASVIWHRTQVICIFAGFSILLLVASPLLLLAAPCIVCCKCRVCTGSSALDDDLPPPTDLPDPHILASDS